MLVARHLFQTFMRPAKAKHLDHPATVYGIQYCDNKNYQNEWHYRLGNGLIFDSLWKRGTVTQLQKVEKLYPLNYTVHCTEPIHIHHIHCVN